VAEAWGQYRNPEKRDRSPLETVTRQPVKTLQAKKSVLWSTVKRVEQ
jgi:hypothetical protein